MAYPMLQVPILFSGLSFIDASPCDTGPYAILKYVLAQHIHSIDAQPPVIVSVGQ